MKYLKKYRIPFSGLSTGKHSFDFEVDEKFFACYEHSLIKEGDLKVVVELQKQENMLIANFDIKGSMKLTCDVCLSQFDAPIHIQERALIKFSEEDWQDDTEEVVMLSKNDYELDIAPLLYEYINVAVPPYTKCSEQGENISCDPEMLNMIQNEQDEESSIADDENIDPRWEALKNIKNN
ncbi:MULTISPECIES: YceD family protein [Sphingobacterium]|uniref:DUF177 domain-containing protein n=1 Tax=Sphingobacterium hotanense TaxID=649196 RepID=A0ABT7NPH4_9SPHI|nr:MULTISPECIES: DUF177 domain-containing protein [Sphingobacterium]MCT1524591.1 DUF177 domain-containing protein [Sphingobacterium hotanense]MDM1049151.1 DUF177 domain-containing protein [Sphingobacterium hotanense]